MMERLVVYIVTRENDRIFVSASCCGFLNYWHMLETSIVAKVDKLIGKAVERALQYLFVCLYYFSVRSIWHFLCSKWHRPKRKRQGDKWRVPLNS